MEANLTFFYVTAIIISVLAFGTAIWLYRWVASRPSSNKKVAEVGQLIKNGANTFLAKEYKVLTRFTIVVALLIFVFLPSPIWKGDVLANITMTVSYIFGTVFSAIAGKIGISIATIANVKSAEAATKGIKPS